MNFETLGNFGDFLSGLGVIASFLYLARQIRENTASLRQSVLGIHMQANIETSRLIAADETVANLFHEGLEDREALSEPDRRRFDAFIQILFRTYQHSFELKAAIMEDRSSQIVSGATFLLRTRGVRSWWAQYSGTYTPEFVRFIDDLIEEIPAPT